MMILMHNDMISFKGKKKLWWSKIKSSFPSIKVCCFRRKDEKEGSLYDKLNVNEEYKGVFRTKSYMEIRSKVQVIQPITSPKTLGGNYLTSPSYYSSSPSSSSSPLPLPFYIHLSDLLLEPCQEAVIDIIKSSKIQTLLIDYLEASLEACNVCESLLRALHKTRCNHQRIKRVIKLSQSKEKYEGEGHLSKFNYGQCYEMVLQELASYASLSNPLSIITNGLVNFPLVHDEYALLLRRLCSRRRELKRKEKFTRFYRRAAGYGIIIAFIVLTITVLALAIHSMVGVVVTPGLLLSFSMVLIKKVRDNNEGSLRINLLKHLGSQLDIAAKGIYIFVNDFDTVERLVTRIHDDVEHKRDIAAMCVRNEKNLDVVKEALRDMNMHEQGFSEQLQELEEHIYLCFLTINRSRRLVFQEILAPLSNL